MAWCRFGNSAYQQVPTDEKRGPVSKNPRDFLCARTFFLAIPIIGLLMLVWDSNILFSDRHTGCVGPEDYLRSPPPEDPLWKLADFPQSLSTRTGETHDVEIERTYGRIRTIVERLDIKKLVVYGLSIAEAGKGHTHSYIHLGWFRSMLDIAMHFPSRRLVVCWYDKNNKLQPDDVRKALVFTSPAHGKYIAEGLPYSDTSYYVSHGSVSGLHELEKAVDDKRLIRYEKPNKKRINTNINIGPIYSSYDPTTRVQLQHWAADLTPWEILARRKKVLDGDVQRSKAVVFLGTVWWENISMFLSMVKASRALGLVMHQYGRILWTAPTVSKMLNMLHMVPLYLQMVVGNSAYKHDNGGATVQEAADIMGSTMLAPAVQGAEQIQIGYLPCRMFKTIAAGALGLSNNPHVRSVFPETPNLQPIVVEDAHSNATAMFKLLSQGGKIMSEPKKTAHRIADVMLFVAREHTYLSRFSSALSVFACEAGFEADKRWQTEWCKKSE